MKTEDTAVENPQASKEERVEEQASPSGGPTTTKTHPDGQHPLDSSWTLWYLKRDCTRRWESCLTKLCTVSTLEQLYSALCSIVPASQLVQGSDYYLFKEGIKPLWEEEDNLRGGRWTIPISKRHRQKRLDSYWPELIGAMVGEQFGGDGDQICGAAVSVRFKVDVIQLWTRDAVTGEGDAANRRIGALAASKMGLDEREYNGMGYESHRDVWKRWEG